MHTEQQRCCSASAAWTLADPTACTCPQDFHKAAEEVQREAQAAEQGLHRYGALLSQLPPTVRALFCLSAGCPACFACCCHARGCRAHCLSADAVLLTAEQLARGSAKPSLMAHAQGGVSSLTLWLPV